MPNSQAIAAALRENHTLTELNLEHNSLGEGGAQAFAHCAKITRSQSSTLERVCCLLVLNSVTSRTPASDSLSLPPNPHAERGVTANGCDN